MLFRTPEIKANVGVRYLRTRAWTGVRHALTARRT